MATGLLATAVGLAAAGCAGLGHGAGKAGGRGDAPASTTAVRYTGKAFDAETGAALYTETHEVAAGGLKETVRYQTLRGQPLGEKTVDFTGDAYAPLYRLTLQSGYTESVTARSADGRRLDASYRNGPRCPEGNQEHAGPIAVDDADPLIVDAGLDRFVADNLPALARGESLVFHLAVVPNIDSYTLRVEKIADTTFEGRPAVQLEVNADSMLLRLLAEPARATYDLQSRRARRFEGKTGIRDPRTCEVYDRVRIEFSAPEAVP